MPYQRAHWSSVSPPLSASLEALTNMDIMGPAKPCTVRRTAELQSRQCQPLETHSSRIHEANRHGRLLRSDPSGLLNLAQRPCSSYPLQQGFGVASSNDVSHV